MAEKSNYGICRLCGKYQKLEYEHVPPRAALNSKPAKTYSGLQMIKNMQSGKLPWNFDGMRYKSLQKGLGGYYLCKKCNNNTGSWYAKDYSEFIVEIKIDLPISDSNIIFPADYRTEEELVNSIIYQ